METETNNITRIGKAQRKQMPVWTNVEPAVHAAMKQYLEDKGMTISEFVRACIAARLLDAGYLGQEQLETVLYGT